MLPRPWFRKRLFHAAQRNVAPLLRGTCMRIRLLGRWCNDSALRTENQLPATASRWLVFLRPLAWQYYL
eukprot:COSAG02_NODE_46_length_45443_cov_36.731497_11_plen_69_part_00